MEVGKADALGVQPIEMGCLEDRVSVAAEIAIPLIVGYHEYDIWRWAANANE